MKNKRKLMISGFSCIWLLCLVPSAAFAVEAYFDTEVTTKLETQKEVGTLLIKMLNEDVPPVFTDVVYERVINVEIIFDASKTMDDPDINGMRKVDVAKRIVTVLVNAFPQRDTRFALRVNGAKLPNNCLDSELVVPFRRENAQEILNAIETIRPKGLSPVTYAIRQVMQDFAGTKGTKIVFVVTDGLETCDNEPVDACTTTMDMLLSAEFDGSINVLGVNTIYDDVRSLLSCLSARGRGDFLDSNRSTSDAFAKLIWQASQLRYSISKVIDPETLSEGKILELLNRRIGDVSMMDGENIVLKPEQRGLVSSHELTPGVYKIELATIPVLSSYFTIDRRQQLTVGVVRSGQGLDIYDRAHLALGNRYYDQGQFQEALAEYQKIVEFDNRHPDAHLNMGVIYGDILGDKAEAEKHYKAYLESQGPRQEEVREWLRLLRGDKSQQEVLDEKIREAEAEKARKEAERLAAEDEKKRQAERQKAIDAYNEILTANPAIVELPQDDVISGDTLHVKVSEATTDFQAEKIAQDVAKRMNNLLKRAPKVVVARRDNPDVPIATIEAGNPPSSAPQIPLQQP